MTIRLAAALLALFIAALCPAAGAHSIGADCYATPDGKRLAVEVWMGDNEPPKRAGVTVRRPDGTVLAAGEADADGRFVFTPEAAVPYDIAIDCGLGHGKRLRVRPEELAKLNLAAAEPVVTKGPPQAAAPQALPAREHGASTGAASGRAMRVTVGLCFIAALTAALCAAAALKAVRRIERRLPPEDGMTPKN